METVTVQMKVPKSIMNKVKIDKVKRDKNNIQDTIVEVLNEHYRLEE